METKAYLLDAKAKRLAKTLLDTEGEILTTLMEMSRTRAFIELDYTGVFDYCLRALSFSEQQAFYFKKVAEVSVVVPELKEAIVQGELTLSRARRIAPVLTPGNQAEWIEKAKTLKQRDLEKAVTEVNPQAHPIERIRPVAKNVAELRVAIDDETDQDLAVLKDLLSQKLKRPATLKEVIAWATKETREKHDPERKALRAQKFPRGKNLQNGVTSPATMAKSTPEDLSPRQEKLTTQNKAERTSPPRRRPIPAGIRHEVVRSQGHRCSYIGRDKERCTQRSWLDFS